MVDSSDAKEHDGADALLLIVFLLIFVSSYLCLLVSSFQEGMDTVQIFPELRSSSKTHSSYQFTRERELFVIRTTPMLAVVVLFLSSPCYSFIDGFPYSDIPSCCLLLSFLGRVLRFKDGAPQSWYMLPLEPLAFQKYSSCIPGWFMPIVIL